MRRHAWRPSHLHFIVKAPGYRTLVTEVFPDDDPYLDQDTVFGGFLDKVLQLRASTYPSADEAVDDATVEEVFGVEFSGESGALDTLRLARVKDTERSTDEEIVWKYVAQTQRTRQWVIVSKATASDLADQFLQVVE